MENQPTIEQEIAQLEQQLAEKRASFGREGEEGGGPLSAGEVESAEKETLHEIIGERIQQHTSQYRSAPQPTQAKPQQDDAALSYVLPELKDKIQELVNLVFNKSLDEGIKEASKSNNPALIDAFHDVLVDELYNALLERKKLETIK